MERTAPDRREEIYSDPITKQTFAKLVGDGLAAAKAHGGAVLDATFSRRANRDFLREQCRRAHARLEIVELDVDLATIRTRLAARNRSAGETSDARLEDLEKLTAAYEPPTELFNSLIQVPARGPILETTKSILLRLSRKRLSWANRVATFPIHAFVSLRRRDDRPWHRSSAAAFVESDFVRTVQ